MIRALCLPVTESLPPDWSSMVNAVTTSSSSMHFSLFDCNLEKIAPINHMKIKMTLLRL